MSPTLGFHPDALLEYAEATNYYLTRASPPVAEGFVSEVESGIAAILAAPTRWRITDPPETRRYVFRRYPYAIYYRFEPQRGVVEIYAVMHCSREPGYWHHRLAGGG